MATNPLQKYFRQPKIYVNLPTKGMFNEPGTLVGDPENMPIYGMTGMDEILMKTPDALLKGESTVKVIESCCPSIKNGWDVNILDLDLILSAIRIATHGNTMTISHSCNECKETSDFEIELGNIITHFNQCAYDGKIVLKDLIIRLRPLSYKKWTEFQMVSFNIQRQMTQIIRMEESDEQTKLANALYEQMANLQRETLLSQIEAVEVPEGVVDQRTYIQEWIETTEQAIYDAIKNQIEKNRLAWEIPKMKVTCPDCSAENEVGIDMDQSSFFASA